MSALTATSRHDSLRQMYWVGAALDSETCALPCVPITLMTALLDEPDSPESGRN